MVGNLRYTLVGLVLILFFSVVSAGFEVGDISHSIDSIYGPGDSIRGWVNISFSEEKVDSLFDDFRGNSIRFINLLKKSENYDYSCDPLDCETDYSASNGETTKTFSLNAGESKIFGLNFMGDLEAINSIKLDLQSDAISSCENQIKINFLDDSTPEFMNDKKLEDACADSKDYGCFNEQGATIDHKISGLPYCQRVEISESPTTQLGAWVKKVDGSMILEMGLYTLGDYSYRVANCELPEASEGEISCDVDYPIYESADYYVCIYPTSGDGDYRILGNSNPSTSCGFYGFPPKSEGDSYKIFAQGKKFDAVGTLSITNTFSQGNLGILVEDYLITKYGSSLNCQNGCVAPIRFISGDNQETQQITLSGLEVEYQKAGSGILIENNFYDLDESPALVDSEFQKLYLDEGNFSVSNNIGDYIFRLNLGNQRILSEEVLVKDVPMIKSITPTKTASAYPTDFEVGVSSPENITKYNWDFGDNSTKTTTTNKTTHTYSSTGTYKLKITITDSKDFSSSKTFNIEVGSPKEIINTLLEEMQENLNNLKTEINTMTLFYQESLNSVFKIESVEIKLDELESEYDSAVSDEDYTQILGELLELSVPESVTLTKSSGLISFYPEKENVNLDILQLIGGGSYDNNEDAYIDAVLFWGQQNIDAKIRFDEISAKYEQYEKPAVRIFELKIDKKQASLGEETYLILSKLDNLQFKENYLEKEEGNYIYISLSDSNTIVFSTTEDIDFLDLPAFIGPSINKLSVAENGGIPIEAGGEESKWTIFILIISLLVLIGFITYIVLQQWYKKKYEKYLFKNKNNLYNMVTYVNHAKKKGMAKKEISENLKKAGWGSEKIKYVMRKYAGKRTGMFEIPVSKILGNSKTGPAKKR